MKDEISEDKLKTLYCLEKKSMREIADILGYKDHSSVRHLLNKFKIKSRSRKESLLNYSKNIFTISDIEREIIIGELLGDGCLYKDKRCKDSYPYFRYTSKHEEYLEFLKKNLSNVSWGNIKKKVHKKENSDGSNSVSYELFSHVSESFEDIYNMFYFDYKKRLPENLKITPTILRHWFMGDGTAGLFSNGKNKKSWQITIYSCCFDREKLEQIIIPQLKKEGINAKINKQGKYNRIRISSDSFDNFYNFIGECPVGCYNYKWNENKKMNQNNIFNFLNNSKNKNSTECNSEKIKLKIFESLRNLYEKNIIVDKKIMNLVNLDLYFPDKNFGIIINDSILNSELTLEKQKAYKFNWNKTKICEEHGIRVFQIFEHNFYGNENKNINYIRNILGSNSKKIAARKCKIVDFPAPNLISENHIQGLGGYPIKYFTLIHENEVVATMTASKHHRQNDTGNNVILHRLAFSEGVNVVGGASKLFSALVDWSKKENYDSIISWSDNSYSNGNIYKILGFEMEKEYNPDYFYFDLKNRCYKSKQSQKKSSTGCPVEKTERDWCYENGLYRIWDIGKKKWIFKLQK